MLDGGGRIIGMNNAIERRERIMVRVQDLIKAEAGEVSLHHRNFEKVAGRA